MHNDGTPPCVAIRWQDVKVPPQEKWLVENGDSHDDAGAKVARTFSDHIRKEGERLIAWANRIDQTLARV